MAGDAGVVLGLGGAADALAAVGAYQGKGGGVGELELPMQVLDHRLALQNDRLAHSRCRRRNLCRGRKTTNKNTVGIAERVY